MPAHDTAERGEDARVEHLERLGEPIKDHAHPELACPVKARREEKENDGEREERIELDERVEAKIAVPVAVAVAPVEDAHHAHDDQHRKERRPDALADPLAKDHAEERHEAERHRQSIPEEARAVRREVVVARPEGGEEHASEQNEQRPALAKIIQARRAPGALDLGDPQEPDQREGEVREDVETVGDAEDVAGVGEPVVGGVLMDRRQKEHDRRGHRGRSDEDEGARLFSYRSQPGAYRH